MGNIIQRLAFRNIFRNPRRTFLTVLLISSAVIALIFTDGLMVGMRALLIHKVTSTWLGHAQVHHAEFRDSYDVNFRIKDPTGIEAILEQDPDVEAYALRTFSGGMIASSNNVVPGAIFGVQPDNEPKVSRLKEAHVGGEFITGATKNEIMIGTKMAELLEVQLGDRIVVTLSEADTAELSQTLFRVSGILQFNERSMDQEMAFVSLASGQKMLGLGNGVHEIAIAFKDGVDEAAVLERLGNAINTESVEFLSWRGLIPDLAGWLEMSDISTLIIGIILFILVSLGLINSMFMSIYERHYEFGVMLGLGTAKRQVFWLICWEGFFVALIASGLGIILGYFLTSYLSVHGLSFGDQSMEMNGITLNEPVKTIMRWQQFVLVPAFITILTALACIIPAIHGARLVPADALRRAL